MADPSIGPYPWPLGRLQLPALPVAPHLAPATLSPRPGPVAELPVRTAFVSRPLVPCEFAVAVPVRDEQRRVTLCLDALHASIRNARATACIVTLVNNTRDDSFAIIRRWAERHATPVVALDVDLPLHRANAGWARRLAMDTASLLTTDHGVIATTDADSRVDVHWAQAQLAAFGAGAEVVCGRIEPDPVEQSALPAAVLRREAAENDYATLARELQARLDPCPHNPWPHHGSAGGASLACTPQVYRELGGMPPLAVGEDRAFVAAALTRDKAVRYADSVRVTASCRLVGRATGGMADTIAAHVESPNSLCDEALESADTTALRAAARARLRQFWRRHAPCADLFTRLGLSPDARPLIGTFQHFGAAWAWIERTSPALVRKRLRPSDLAEQAPALRCYLRAVRATTPPAARQAA